MKRALEDEREMEIARKKKKAAVKAMDGKGAADGGDDDGSGDDEGEEMVDLKEGDDDDEDDDGDEEQEDEDDELEEVDPLSGPQVQDVSSDDDDDEEGEEEEDEDEDDDGGDSDHDDDGDEGDEVEETAALSPFGFLVWADVASVMTALVESGDEPMGAESIHPKESEEAVISGTVNPEVMSSEEVSSVATQTVAAPSSSSVPSQILEGVLFDHLYQVLNPHFSFQSEVVPPSVSGVREGDERIVVPSVLPILPPFTAAIASAPAPAPFESRIPMHAGPFAKRMSFRGAVNSQRMLSEFIEDLNAEAFTSATDFAMEVNPMLATLVNFHDEAIVGSWVDYCRKIEACLHEIELQRPTPEVLASNSQRAAWIEHIVPFICYFEQKAILRRKEHKVASSESVRIRVQIEANAAQLKSVFDNLQRCISVGLTLRRTLDIAERVMQDCEAAMLEADAKFSSCVRQLAQVGAELAVVADEEKRLRGTCERLSDLLKTPPPQ